LKSRERCGSTGSIEETRKKMMLGEGGKRGRERIFSKEVI